MPEDLTLEEVEIERRSMAMLRPDGPSWMSAGRVRQILEQLGRALQALRERDAGPAEGSG